MKLKTLKIHNIASIGDAVLNFDAPPLSDEHLFLITGNTGAGKSTLLDCICLALFADTPRLTDANNKVEMEEDVKTNDVRQLLRRGAVEAAVELTFDDNAGVTHIAKWTVARARKKLDGKLQKAEWSLTNTATGIVIDKKKDVSNALKAIMGMGLEQFSQTVILPQGQFSEFLKAKDDQRSDMLEKITGTDIYSLIGRQVFEITKEKEEEKKIKEQGVSNIVLLSDEEKAELSAKLAENREQSKLLTEKQTLTDGKKQWLTKNRGYNEALAAKQQQLARVNEAIQKPQFVERQQLVADYERTAEARAWLEARRRAAQDLQTEQAKSAKLEKQWHAKRPDASSSKPIADQLTALLKELERTREKLHAADARAEQQKLTDRTQQLSKVKTACAVAADRQKTLADARKTFEKDKQDFEQAKKNLAAARVDTQKALKQKEAAEQEYNKVKDCADKFTKQLRASLRAGSICPVCGTKVTSVPHDTDFDALVEPTLAQFTAAKKTLDDCQVKLARAQADCDAKGSALEQADFTLKHREKEAETAQRNFLTLAKPLAPAKTALTEDDINKLIDSDKKRSDELNKIVEQERKLTEEINQWQLFANNYRQQQDAVTNASDTLKYWQERLNGFYRDNKGFDEEKLTQLDAHQQADITSIKLAVANQLASLEQLKGSIHTLEEQLAAHQQNMPMLQADDTETALEQQLLALREQLATLQAEKGANDQKLQADADNVKRHARALKELEVATQEYLKWQAFCDIFGDSAGKKFRAIAQSFILRNLTDMANTALTHFNARYSLQCRSGSLAIFVYDNIKCCQASIYTLSGGELFMASLALALALSGMGGKVAPIDTLFIDEGFGSLSQECLDAVLTTLNSLPELTHRRIGIISHVDALKQYVPVQIHVCRTADNTQSKILLQ